MKLLTGNCQWQTKTSHNKNVSDKTKDEMQTPYLTAYYNKLVTIGTVFRDVKMFPHTGLMWGKLVRLRDMMTFPMIYLEHDDILNDLPRTWWHTKWFTLNMMTYSIIYLEHDDILNTLPRTWWYTRLVTLNMILCKIIYLEHDDILHDLPWTWWYTQWFTLNMVIYSIIYLEHDDILNNLPRTWWYTRLVTLNMMIY